MIACGQPNPYPHMGGGRLLIRDAVCIDDDLSPTIHSSSNFALFVKSSDEFGIISINNVREGGKVKPKSK